MTDMIGLFLVRRFSANYGFDETLQIVGEIQTAIDKAQYLCRDLHDPERACRVIDCADIRKAITERNAAIFTNEADCLRYFNDHRNSRAVFNQFEFVGFEVEEGDLHASDVSVTISTGTDKGFALTLYLGPSGYRRTMHVENAQIDAAHIEVSPPKSLPPPRRPTRYPLLARSR